MRHDFLTPDLPKRPLAFELGAALLIAALCLIGARQPKPPTGDGLFDRWRGAVVARVEDVFDPPVSAWVAGLLLGADDGFSRRWIDAFRRTGTSHLTAVSGYNVGVVMAGALAVLKRLPFGRVARAAASLGAVAAFVLLTGSPGSVLRAAFMIGAVEIARLFGRPVKPLRALLLAALVIGVLSPRSLIADRGFQLSALASFGLATLAPPLAWAMRRWPKTLAEWTSQTVAASLATAPLIAMISGSYSLVALPANLAVTAFIPFLMAGGAALLGLSVLSVPLARVLAGVTRGLFLLPLVTIRFMASLPLASIGGLAAFAVLAAAELAAVLLILHARRRASERYGL